MSKVIQDLRARYNANGNAIIPNTFQHPNIFIDRLMCYLSPAENTVLTFAVRRILGFQDNIMSRKDNISLSQFTDGITTEDGRPLSRGCGLGSSAVRDALDALSRFKILLPTTAQPDPRRGQEYWLQDNELEIDWDGLEERAKEKLDKDIRRTQKARYSVRQKGSVGQKARGVVGQKARGLLDSNTKPTETHINPIKEEEAKSAKSTGPAWDNAPADETPNIFRVYEQEIGVLTQHMADELMEAEAVHTTRWVIAALKICSENGKRNWNYAKAILGRWKAEGYGTEKGGKFQKQAEPDSREALRRKVIADVFGQ